MGWMTDKTPAPTHSPEPADKPALPEIFAGQVLGFMIPSQHARGRAVRLDAVLDEILSAHDYPPPITHLLAEALVLIALPELGVSHDASALAAGAVICTIRLLSIRFKWHLPIYSARR